MKKLETGKYRNTRFGKWSVLEVGLGTPRRPKWLCRCDCGIEKLVDRTNILAGTSKSCSKCRGRLGNKNPGWKGHKDIPAHFYSILLKSAEVRNIEIKLSIQDVQKLWEGSGGKCALSGVEIKMGSKKLGLCASIDRIDSKKPYEFGNIQFVHKDVNLMKNKFNQEYFIEMCKKITSHAS